MKRDLDLVREILMFLEGCEGNPPKGGIRVQIEGGARPVPHPRACRKPLREMRGVQRISRKGLRRRVAALLVVDLVRVLHGDLGQGPESPEPLSVRGPQVLRQGRPGLSPEQDPSRASQEAP